MVTIIAMSRKITQKKANLRDVAKASGVSVATVSRVMNSPQTVSPKTRARVEIAIRDLKFVPSAAARAINSGRTRFVGALVPTLDNAIFARFLAAMETRLIDSGLALVVATTNDDPEIEVQRAENMLKIGAEGLVVSGVTHHPDLHTLIERSQLPAIATSYYDLNADWPTIGYDNASASRLALQHLLDLNHRKIAVVHGPAEKNDRTRARLNGLTTELDVDFRFYETRISVESGVRAARDMLQDQDAPSAVLCLSDVLAHGVLFEFQRSGAAVPDRFSVVGIDDLPASAHSVPRLTTVHLPVSQMGTTTAEAMAAWVEDKVVPDSTQIHPVLQERESTAKYQPC